MQWQQSWRRDLREISQHLPVQPQAVNYWPLKNKPQRKYWLMLQITKSFPASGTQGSTSWAWLATLPCKNHMNRTLPSYSLREVGCRTCPRAALGATFSLPVLIYYVNLTAWCGTAWMGREKLRFFLFACVIRREGGCSCTHRTAFWVSGAEIHSLLPRVTLSNEIINGLRLGVISHVKANLRLIGDAKYVC